MSETDGRRRQNGETMTIDLMSRGDKSLVEITERRTLTCAELDNRIEDRRGLCSKPRQRAQVQELSAPPLNSLEIHEGTSQR